LIVILFLLDNEMKAATFAGYQGELKTKNEKYASKESEDKAAILSSYQGEIKLQSIKQDELNYEFMSKVVHNYKGNLKSVSQNKKDKNSRELSARNQQIIGEYRLKYKFVKDLEYQVISARVHNWEGGEKTSWITRAWYKITDKSGEKYKKANNTEKKPKYDTRESEIWYH